MIGTMGIWGIKQESRVFTLLGLTLPRDGLPSLTMPHEASIPRLALSRPASPKPILSSHAQPCRTESCRTESCPGEPGQSSQTSLCQSGGIVPSLRSFLTMLLWCCSDRSAWQTLQSVRRLLCAFVPPQLTGLIWSMWQRVSSIGSMPTQYALCGPGGLWQMPPSRFQMIGRTFVSHSSLGIRRLLIVPCLDPTNPDATYPNQSKLNLSRRNLPCSVGIMTPCLVVTCLPAPYHAWPSRVAPKPIAP